MRPSQADCAGRRITAGLSGVHMLNRCQKSSDHRDYQNDGRAVVEARRKGETAVTLFEIRAEYVPQYDYEEEKE